MFPSRMESKLFILMSKTLSSPAPSLPSSPPAWFFRLRPPPHLQSLHSADLASTPLAPSLCPHELPAEHTLPLHAPLQILPL